MVTFKAVARRLVEELAAVRKRFARWSEYEKWIVTDEASAKDVAMIKKTLKGTSFANLFDKPFILMTMETEEAEVVRALRGLTPNQRRTGNAKVNDYTDGIVVVQGEDFYLLYANEAALKRRAIPLYRV